MDSCLLWKRYKRIQNRRRHQRSRHRRRHTSRHRRHQNRYLQDIPIRLDQRLRLFVHCVWNHNPVKFVWLQNLHKLSFEWDFQQYC